MDDLIDQREASDIVGGKFQKAFSIYWGKLSFECKIILSEYFLLLYTKSQLLYCLLRSPYIV